MSDLHATIPAGRRKLAAVLSAGGDIIRIADAQTVLNTTRTEAAKLLSRWTAQGWLRRVGTGIYAPVTLESLASTHVIDDPWILVPALFEPGYITGRSAAEHWDLTEQIFRDIVVMTARPVRKKTAQHHGALFTLKHIRAENIFGTQTIWRGQSKIQIADLHRTIIDMLDVPALGSGIQHIADCLRIYLDHPERDDQTLIAYGDRLGNGAVFKRLGFLAERQEAGQALITPCRTRLTKGYAKLDPALKCTRLITRWRLRVPQSWAHAINTPAGAHD